LESVEFEAGSRLRVVEKEAFFLDSCLRKIALPSGVREICCSAFENFDEVILDPQNPALYFQRQMLYTRGEKTLVRPFWKNSVLAVPADVVAIASYAFWRCSWLSKVLFPRSRRLRRIDDFAFVLSGLETITLPQNVRIIGRSCFANCEKLRQVRFESDSRIERIECFAFYNCGLKSLTLPVNLSFVDGKSLHTLHSIAIEQGNPHFVMENSMLYDVNRGSLLWSFSNDHKQVVPKSVEFIGDFAYNAGLLHEPVFEAESSLWVVGRYSFAEWQLQRLVVPKSTEVITGCAFRECAMLWEVVFEQPVSLKRIEEQAFAFGIIAHIAVPRTVEAIGRGAFQGNLDLVRVEFEPDSLLAVVEEAAFMSSAITGICIPRRVQVIPQICFQDCAALGTVAFEEGSELRRIEAEAFAGSNQLHSVELPAQIEFVAPNAFSASTNVIAVEGMTPSSSQLVTGFHPAKFESESRFDPPF
jgi:hypothetical protein